jgi:predicted polyphosphate/ATP-dependent NAD kinase
MLKARLAQEQNTPPPKPGTVAPPTTPTAVAVAAAAEADKNPLLSKPVATNTTSADPTKKAAAEPASVLPKVEVKKGRVTKLDQDLAKQDEEIAREKKNTKISDVDKALNDSKLAKPLAIFGGESSQFRQHVASERVSLMEDEKDLIEAIAHAKTKDEKAALQKQLDALRTERRELERALR